MKISINQKIINKNETNERSQAKGFEPFDLTAQEFAEHISSGHAFSYQFTDGYRKADNFLCSDIIAADIDEGMTLEEALADEFIINNACIIYTSASHTPEFHKFRVIFQTPQTITDGEMLRAAQRGLARKLKADAAATDPARQFYGSRDCEIHLFPNILSEECFTQLVELGAQPIGTPDSPNKKITAGSQSDLLLEPDQTVKIANGDMQLLRDMENSQPIYCPFHRDSKPSAFTTKSRLGIIGIHCSSCQLTFWPQSRKPPAYDFLVFDKLAQEQAALPPEQTWDETGVVTFETPNPHRIFSQRYLDPETILPLDGITLIKSPKGSGKTEYLSHLVQQCKKRGLSVLLIGHRRALLRSLAARLGLKFYLDHPPTHRKDQCYAISVDSLATLLEPEIHHFKVILIDESEQVFSHLLSDTMKNDLRRHCYLQLQFYIRYAQQVVALDADLNEVTLHAIQRFSEKNPFYDRRFILNHFSGTNNNLELYADEKHLIEDLFTDIETGKRLFVCCNTKKQVEVLTHSIIEKYGVAFPVLSITSANSNEKLAITFVTAPAVQILNYQVVIVSPAIGTGIDITFPDNAQLIDCVYGIFQPLINTHYDIDQQISRVRHPSKVRLWITPQEHSFETESDPIVQELATSGLFPHVMIGYLRRGTPEYNWKDPFILLYATILSSQRASKNHLKKNFISLRQYNGWSITSIDRDRLASARGEVIQSIGRGLRMDKLIADVMATEAIERDEADELMDLRETQRLSPMQEAALTRYFIEQFYREPISPSLIMQDNEGWYRDQIRLLEKLLALDTARMKIMDTNVPERLLYELLLQAGILTAPQTINRDIILRSTHLVPFIKYCRDNKPKIERIFKIDIRNDIDAKPIAQLNKFLRVCGMELLKKRTISTSKGKIYEYGLNLGGLDQALAIIERRKTPTR